MDGGGLISHRPLLGYTSGVLHIIDRHLLRQTPALLGAILRLEPRSFSQDARRMAAGAASHWRRIGPAPRLDDGSWVITTNHTTGPDLHSWWLPILITASLNRDVTWLMTNCWRYPDRLRRSTLTPISRWMFERLAQVYGFITMPPMPPAVQETRSRADSIRRVLRCAEARTDCIFGFAPEGADPPQGGLQIPPSGVGRFIALLVRRGFEVLPVGAYHADGQVCLRFGLPYRPVVAPALRPDELDASVSRQLMLAIADCLPAHLHGAFAHRAAS
jgi:hypothetical protein